MPGKHRSIKGKLVIDGIQVTYHSMPEKIILETYNPLIVRNELKFHVYRPKTGTSITNVVEPAELVLMKRKMIQRIPITPELQIFLARYSPYLWNPDFYCPVSGNIIEYKGEMDTSFPRVVETFKEQHPGWWRKFRILFQKPDLRIPRRPSLTYQAWAEQLGLEWAYFDPTKGRKTGTIPLDWLKSTSLPSPEENAGIYDDWLGLDEENDDVQ